MAATTGLRSARPDAHTEPGFDVDQLSGHGIRGGFPGNASRHEQEGRRRHPPRPSPRAESSELSPKNSISLIWQILPSEGGNQPSSQAPPDSRRWNWRATERVLCKVPVSGQRHAAKYRALHTQTLEHVVDQRHPTRPIRQVATFLPTSPKPARGRARPGWALPARSSPACRQRVQIERPLPEGKVFDPLPSIRRDCPMRACRQETIPTPFSRSSG